MAPPTHPSAERKLEVFTVHKVPSLQPQLLVAVDIEEEVQANMAQQDLQITTELRLCSKLIKIRSNLWKKS